MPRTYAPVSRRKVLDLEMSLQIYRMIGFGEIGKPSNISQLSQSCLPTLSFCSRYLPVYQKEFRVLFWPLPTPIPIGPVGFVVRRTSHSARVSE